MALSPQCYKELLQYANGCHRQLLLQHIPSKAVEGMAHRESSLVYHCIIVVGGKKHQWMLKLASQSKGETEYWHSCKEPHNQDTHKLEREKE